jgi:hypothetical protein
MEQNLVRSIINLHPAPPLPIRIMIRQFPATFTLRRRDPQSQEMAPGSRRLVVSVGLARMVEMVVSHEVDISDLKDIADGFFVASLIKELNRLCLCIGERGDDAFVREPLERPNVVWIKSTIENVSIMASRLQLGSGLTHLEYTLPFPFSM